MTSFVTFHYWPIIHQLLKLLKTKTIVQCIDVEILLTGFELYTIRRVQSSHYPHDYDHQECESLSTTYY